MIEAVLSIQQCREILGPSAASLSDEDVERFRDQCRLIALIIQQEFLREKSLAPKIDQDYVADQTTDRLVRAQEIAKMLSLSVRKVWRLVAEGKLPPPEKIGRSSRWRLSEVEKFMMSRKE